MQPRGRKLGRGWREGMMEKRARSRGRYAGFDIRDV